MIQPQPLIALSDVEAGSLWFQEVLGVTSGHGGREYETLIDGNTMVAQLHNWDADEHPHLGDPSEPSRGNGVLLRFWTDDFKLVMDRVRAIDADMLGPLVNPNSGLLTDGEADGRLHARPGALRGDQRHGRRLPPVAHFAGSSVEDMLVDPQSGR